MCAAEHTQAVFPHIWAGISGSLCSDYQNVHLTICSTKTLQYIYRENMTTVYNALPFSSWAAHCHIPLQGMPAYKLIQKQTLPKTPQINTLCCDKRERNEEAGGRFHDIMFLRLNAEMHIPAMLAQTNQLILTHKHTQRFPEHMISQERKTKKIKPHVCNLHTNCQGFLGSLTTYLYLKIAAPSQFMFSFFPFIFLNKITFWFPVEFSFDRFYYRHVTQFVFRIRSEICASVCTCNFILKCS